MRSSGCPSRPNPTPGCLFSFAQEILSTEVNPHIGQCPALRLLWPTLRYPEISERLQSDSTVIPYQPKSFVNSALKLVRQSTRK